MVVNLGFPSANIQEIREVLAAQLPGFVNARRVVYVYTLNDPVRDEALESRQRYINDLMHLREYNIRSYLPMPLRPAARSAAVRWILPRIQGARIARETEAWYRDLHRDGPGWREARRVLADMIRMCRERDVEFVLAVFPLLHRLDRYPFVEVHETLRLLAEQEGVRFVDLRPAFLGKDETTLWVHPTDFHPNRLAHHLAGSTWPSP